MLVLIYLLCSLCIRSVPGQSKARSKQLKTVLNTIDIIEDEITYLHSNNAYVCASICHSSHHNDKCATVRLDKSSGKCFCGTFSALPSATPGQQSEFYTNINCKRTERKGEVKQQWQIVNMCLAFFVLIFFMMIFWLVAIVNRIRARRIHLFLHYRTGDGS